MEMTQVKPKTKVEVSEAVNGWANGEGQKPRKFVDAAQEALDTFHQAREILGISWYRVQKDFGIEEYRLVNYWKNGKNVPGSVHYGKMLRLVLEKFAPELLKERRTSAPDIRAKQKNKMRRLIHYQNQRSFDEVVSDFAKGINDSTTTEEE